MDHGYQFKELMTCLYIDLDRLIDESSLTESEECVVKLFMDGYRIFEIANYKDVKSATVISLLGRAADKIAARNAKKTQEVFEYKYKNAPFYTLQK